MFNKALFWIFVWFLKTWKKSSPLSETLTSLFHFLFHQHLPSFTLNYSYLLYILALSVFLLCYLKQLIFPLLCFQFCVQFLVCLVSCLCHFSLSLFSRSFIDQLACMISDDISYLFNFSLILQFLLDLLVPPSCLPSTCRAHFSRCFTQFHSGIAPYHLIHSLAVFLFIKYSAFNHFHFEFVLHFRVFQLPPFYSLHWLWCFFPLRPDNCRTDYYSVLFRYTFTNNNLYIHHLLDSSSSHHNVVHLRTASVTIVGDSLCWYLYKVGVSNR